MKNFAVIGVAGYIAERHVRAIKETGNQMVAALDPHDSVGYLDRYFPETDFFVEFERFDRHVERLKKSDREVHFVSICSPNYLHDSHIRFALRNNATAICEKPIVLNPWNIDALQEVERNTGNRVFTILQLRLHPSVIELKKRIEESKQEEKYDVDLSYITTRGNWYHFSWKGELAKSGGIATNIGIHFFDMLSWIFGPEEQNIVQYSDHRTAAGYLEFKRARVRWILSVDKTLLPEEALNKGLTTFRALTLNGESFEFSEGFTDLHTRSYKEILDGDGFGLEDARRSVEIAHSIRNAKTIGIKGDFHPFCKKINC